MGFYAVKGAIKPCEMVERPCPILEGVDIHSSATSSAAGR